MSASDFLRPRRTDTGYGLLLVLLIAVAVGLVVKERRASRPEEQWQPAFARFEGVETLMVVISSSACPGGKAEGFAEAVRIIRAGLRNQAQRKHQTFATIGVALDWKPSAGIAYLETLTPFDEVMAGRSWINAGAIKFFWDEKLGGLAGIPQIVVYERRIRNLGEGQYEVISERVRYRKAGGRAIAEWARLAFSEPMAAN